MNGATTTWCVPATREHPALHLRVQRASGSARGDALYVHGATFPSALSLFFRFDGRSWADALNEAGFNAWGFDFAGYGESARWPAMAQPAERAAPAGRSDSALGQLHSVHLAMQREGVSALHLIAHSWGSIPALRFAAQRPPALRSLSLFGPIAPREGGTPPASPGAWRLLTMWEQYRRFVADVPRGQPPVLADRHIEAWSRAWLATDPDSATRTPPAVKVPCGPVADLLACAGGQALYDTSLVTAPLLLVRGEWDSVCDDDDARRLLRDAAATRGRDVKLARGTHLMHLEENRGALHRAVNEFLLENCP
ncbi:MAG TPA: alpha/beta fold hydrolase [Albitalea sp.]|nr:alpha/beta fold hydrolase [Albitalea sp.]